jgi:hypothetical protein
MIGINFLILNCFFKPTFLFLISTLFLTKEFAPYGWHVSTNTEWTTLEEYFIANGYNYDQTTTENKIAKALALGENKKEQISKNMSLSLMVENRGVKSNYSGQDLTILLKSYFQE